MGTVRYRLYLLDILFELSNHCFSVNRKSFEVGDLFLDPLDFFIDVLEESVDIPKLWFDLSFCKLWGRGKLGLLRSSF